MGSLSATASYVQPAKAADPLHQEIQALQKSGKTSRLAIAILATLSVIFAAAAVVIGFYARAFLGLGLAALAGCISAAVGIYSKKAERDAGDYNNKDLMIKVLNTINQPDLVDDLGTLCQTLYLPGFWFDPGIKMGDLKKHLLEQCSHPGLHKAVDAAFPCPRPHTVVLCETFKDLKSTVSRIRSLNEHLHHINSPTNIPGLLKSYLSSRAIDDWADLHTVYEINTTIASRTRIIKKENVPVLVAAAVNVKVPNLGYCFDLTVIKALDLGRFKEIQVDEHVFISNEMVNEIAKLKRLQRIYCSRALLSPSAKEMFLKHFKPESSYQEYCWHIRK